MKVTQTVFAGKLPIGGGHPVTVQSMTNTDTADAEKTLAQINALHQAGCDIVRLSVYNEACVKAVRVLCDRSPVPLVADIHFDYRLAIRSVENGIHKVRINPGNIGGAARVKELAACLKAHKVSVRIGVNAGSVEKQILARDGGVTPRGMVDSALSHARLLEKEGFDSIVLSLKSSDIRDTYAAYTLASQCSDYPLHLGITEAGLPEQGTVRSAIGIGALLLSGIGDTLRVSLTGDPVHEVRAGLQILRALGLRKDRIRLVACPTCGRTAVDVQAIARAVEEELDDIHEPITVAVMGCVVNGPGEAREADIGIAGGADGAALFIKGCPPRKVTGDLKTVLVQTVRDYVNGHARP
jgi:(E)-4-hydroxy-3-methylbut-2-enyl-diphosphate synthase